MKNIVKLLAGFPFGVAVLVFTYVLIGAIDGEAKFTEEIMKLTEYEYLLRQVIQAGISYVIVVWALKYYYNFARNGVERGGSTWQELFKLIVSQVFIVPICFALMESIDKKDTFQGYIGEIFISITILIMIAIAIGMVVYCEIENQKINKVLKQRQERNMKYINN